MTDPRIPEIDPRLRERLRDLPEEVQPARDLWPDIRAQLDAGRMQALPSSGRHAFESSPWYTVPRRLAAAAVLLVAVSSTITWAIANRDAGDDAPPVDASVQAFASFASYERSAAELTAMLDSRGARLDPTTRAVLERTLRTIDGAIAEAREALAADPSNAAVQAFVASAYRQKIDFLRRANDVASDLGS